MVFLRNRKQLTSMNGKKVFVSRNHVLPCFKRTGDKSLSRFDPTHQFHYDGNLFVFDDLIDISHKVVVMTCSLQFFLLRIITNQDLGNLNVIMSSLGDFFAIFF